MNQTGVLVRILTSVEECVERKLSMFSPNAILRSAGSIAGELVALLCCDGVRLAFACARAALRITRIGLLLIKLLPSDVFVDGKGSL